MSYYYTTLITNTRSITKRYIVMITHKSVSIYAYYFIRYLNIYIYIVTRNAFKASKRLCVFSMVHQNFYGPQFSFSFW